MDTELREDLKSRVTPNEKIVAIFREPRKERTESGLFMPTNMNKAQTSGTVVSTGSAVTFIQSGDMVCFNPKAYHEVDVQGHSLMFIHIDDIIAKIS